VFVGIFAGLAPGIHTNLVAVVLVSASPFLLKYTSPVVLAVFIIAISVTNTFLDSIPSIFLGAPDSETALGVLPGHRYLLRGMGYMAVKLTLIGSLGGAILSVLLFPVSIPIVKFIYPLLENYMGYLLILLVLFMILRDKKKLWAVFVFLISGSFGLVVLNMPTLKDPLFPMLSGLFGISTLLISLRDTNSIPEQKTEQDIKIKPWIALKALLSGQFSGFITAVFPGLGAAQAALISMQITRKLGDHGFMILMGSINTVNFILSISALYAIDKARNGSIVAISELMTGIDMNIAILFLAATLISAALSVYFALKIARIFSMLMSKVNYKKVIITVVSFITLLVIILTGPLGFLVLLVSTAIGIIPAEVKVTRTHSMACLLVPVILYFIL
ncbi:MAG: tripartite tricarboxylate transporter permease, partial [Candidatus Woesearchaeota archaeon]|nr:tripartite tricarboxylate transporter permease [Candidatus Woesearchaeota archaeon]